MSWAPIAEELPELLAAFADAERVLGEAFGRAVGRYGYAPPAVEVDVFEPERGEWRAGWRVYTPANRGCRYDDFRCELDMTNTTSWPPNGPVEVSGWLRSDYYVGRGVTTWDDIHETAELRADTPPGAAAAVRRLTAELAGRLNDIDLSPYLLPPAKDA